MANLRKIVLGTLTATSIALTAYYIYARDMDVGKRGAAGTTFALISAIGAYYTSKRN